MLIFNPIYINVEVCFRTLHGGRRTPLPTTIIEDANDILDVTFQDYKVEENVSTPVPIES